MFWLYFARDFYTANTAAAPQRANDKNHHVYHAQLAAVACKSFPRPALVQPQPVAAAPSNPDTVYLERLSAEGDNAFGVWDAEFGFRSFSSNFERVTGLASEECEGHDWIHAIHHDQQYALNEMLLNAEQGTDGSCLVQLRDMQDGWRWMMLNAKAPTASQPHIMVIWRDLTEQKALEETLKQIESSLAMSERGRSAFLSSMSHELRTPLNAIMGFSEMMKAGVFGPLDNPTYQQYAQHIHDSGATLLQKVNDLLDIASMDVGGLELEEGEFNLGELLSEALEIHSHQAFSRGQTIKLDCPNSIALHADRAKLICAISHLIGNAIRHSKNDAEISVIVRAQPDEGVIVSVRDSGEGISNAQLEVIRNALAAEVAYFNIESGGIGLGLSLAKELSARHGGKVMIDSIRTRGTVVSIVLPPERVLSGMPQKRRQRR